MTHFATSKEKWDLLNDILSTHQQSERGSRAETNTETESACQHSALLSPLFVWNQTNLPPLQCGTEGCSHRHAPATFSYSPPLKSSHRPYLNTVLCFLSPHPHQLSLPSLFCWLRPPPSSACFLLWNGALLNHTALLACSLFHSSFFCSLSSSLAASLSERLSCWSTVHREPWATSANEKKTHPGKYSYSLACLYFCWVLRHFKYLP